MATLRGPWLFRGGGDQPVHAIGGLFVSVVEDAAHRQIAYLLIAMLALYVATLQAMVIFGVIAVSEVKEFNVILGPFVTLVAAAISSYYGIRR